MIHEGNPCKKCGCTQRYSNRNCVQCQCAYQAELRLNPEYRERNRAYLAERYLDPELRERQRIYAAEQYSNTEYREKRLAHQAERYLNPELREKRCAYSHAYSKTERGKIVSCASSQRYLAKKLALPNTFTIDEWQQCLSYWEYKCAYCGSIDRLEIEHFISLTSKGELCPGTVKENIVPACKHCNLSKNSKSPYTWATQEALERIEAYFVSFTTLIDL